MEQNPHGQYGIALILELKEAQHALYEHMQETHPRIAPWMCIWNGDPNGHVWPEFKSFIVLCSPVSVFNRMLETKGNGKDVTYTVYDELHTGSPWQLFLLSYDLAEITKDARSPL